MFRILRTRALGRNIKLFEVEAPRIASKQKPGQFVILRLHDRGERIPLTIEGSDPKKGSITLVVQSIGKTTSLMNSLEAGDVILDVVGPLGKPSEIHNLLTAEGKPVHITVERARTRMKLSFIPREFD